jgi:hypothetical protein
LAINNNMGNVFGLINSHLNFSKVKLSTQIAHHKQISQNTPSQLK